MDLQKIIEDTITKDFDNIKILSVNVARDVDFEGDEVLKIEVVFEGTRKDIDARKVSGAVRHVRPHLSAIGEMAFPLLSFVANSDRGRTELAPA
ncbi:hypothetical protein [Devosia salina]|uniref:Uncharacterized protein n=1 Tax=Devosia salina TaxID=2860336 RepID=A0ABX8WD23_9HYPH|nr:hypothetical protein [Devosia salina]QYO75332.1 hypothetical protein K1X15_11795 [Devosia salina]